MTEESEAEESETEESQPKKPTIDESSVIDLKILVIDPNFKYEIAKTTGGENILRCYQCGTCSGICPVYAMDDSFDPQKIIKKALLGLKDDVLSSEFIWFCSTCYACYEHCPQNVKITDLMCAIQNIASREGYAQPTLEDKIKLLKEHARTLPIDSFDNKKRAKFNLPSIEEKAQDTAKIIERSGIEKLAKPATSESQESGVESQESEATTEPAVPENETTEEVQ